MNYLVRIEGEVDVVFATYDEATDYLRHIVALTISGPARLVGQLIETNRPVSAKLVHQNTAWELILVN